MVPNTIRTRHRQRSWRTATGVFGMAAVLVSSPHPAFARQVDLSGVGHDLGEPGAPVRVVEFGDFGCHACAFFARETMPMVEEEFIATGKVFWKYVPMELGIFPNSAEATRAAECASEQNAFWEMHDRLFEEQSTWTADEAPGERFVAYADELGLDTVAFRLCYEENHVAERMETADDIAGRLRVRATPTFFVNGQRVRGASSPEKFREILEKAASGA